MQLGSDAVVFKQGVGKKMLFIPTKLDGDRIACLKEEAHLCLIAASGEEPRPVLTVRGMKMFN